MDGLTLSSLRVDAAKKSGWNIGYFIAGFLFWVYAAFAGQVFALDTLRYALVTGTFFIFPAAVAASKVLGTDPFGKGNPLTELVGFAHMSVILLSLPLILALAVFAPDLLVLAMAILYCIDFYVMSWAFGTAIFAVHAFLRVAAVTLVWTVLPDARAVILPSIVACFYLVTVLAIPLVRGLWLRRQSVDAPKA